MPVVLLNSFVNGISGDSRGGLSDTFSSSQNFDLNQERGTIFPRHAVEDDGATQSFAIEQFEYLQTGNALFGLGTGGGTGGNGPQLYKKNPITGSWAESAGAEPPGAASIVDNKAFRYYANQDRFYGFYNTGGSRRVFAMTPSTFTDELTIGSSALTDVTRPFVHPDDDRIYFSWNDAIHYKDGASAIVQNALSIPKEYNTVDMDKYGSYLVIGCETKNASGKSIAYLWNRKDSDITEAINFGEGNLKMIANVGGRLIGITQIGGIGTPTTFIRKPRIVIRQYVGNSKTRIIREIVGNTGTAFVASFSKAYKEDRVCFLATVSDGDYHGQGIYSFGPSPVSNKLVLTLDDHIDKDPSGSFTPSGMIAIGDYYWASINFTGGNQKIVRPNDSGSALATDATIETDRNPRMDRNDIDMKKQLKRVRLPYITNNGRSLTVNYRTDSNTAWTLLKTVTSSSGDSGVFESDGANTTFREIQFQIIADRLTLKMPFEYEYTVLNTN